eukprot:g17013.t1
MLLPHVAQLTPSEGAHCLSQCAYTDLYRAQAVRAYLVSGREDIESKPEVAIEMAQAAEDIKSKPGVAIETDQELSSQRLVEAVDALECLASWNLRPVELLGRLDGLLVERQVELKYTGNVMLWVTATCSLASLEYRPAAWPLLALQLASDKIFLEQASAPSSSVPLTAVAASAAALGAVGAATQRRGRRQAQRASLAQGRVTKGRTLRGAKLVLCAGASFPEGRKLRVAVVGGGPAGASCADQLAKDGVETFLIERKMDNCKPCGGAIPLCMNLGSPIPRPPRDPAANLAACFAIDEFDLPKDIVDRQVRKMTMISPTNKEVQIGQTLKDDEFIGMVRREVLDDFLRQRAKKNGATLINGLFIGMSLPQNKGDSYLLTYNDYEGQEGNARKGETKTLEVDVVIGADGANSRVAKDIEAGDYEPLGPWTPARRSGA